MARSGPLAGTRYPLGDVVTRVGRGPDNQIVIRGQDAATVSLNHLEIRKQAHSFRICDLGSTNGTYVNGKAIIEADLHAPATIRLGENGPELSFVTEEPAAADLDRTIVIPKGIIPAEMPPAELAATGQYDALLSEAVARARHARLAGIGDQTMIIMRDTMNRMLQHTSRRSRRIIAGLLCALVMISGYAFWQILALKREKKRIDRQIQEVEQRLQQAAGSPDQADQLLSQLAVYQTQAQQLERNLLYRVGVRESEGFLAQEIRSLMAEFGAEVYSIPPEFTERVNLYIEQYQGPDRPLIARALGRAGPHIKIMRQVLEEEQLPPDLAYIPLVESAMLAGRASSAGAAGYWQFTPPTAKGYGLRVDDKVDERLDVRKATRAGCRYLRDLILDFGAGSSVMLALAAYNLGPSKVKAAVMKTVRDPIKQRNFWYLYRIRALPPETREYVPKVIAAIIIGRNPSRFGFTTDAG